MRLFMASICLNKSKVAVKIEMHLQLGARMGILRLIDNHKSMTL